MAIKYYKLLDTLNRRGINKSSLRTELNLAFNTIAKFSSNETVSLEVIDKLCKYLNVQPGDLMEFVDEEENEVKK